MTKDEAFAWIKVLLTWGLLISVSSCGKAPDDLHLAPGETVVTAKCSCTVNGTIKSFEQSTCELLQQAILFGCAQPACGIVENKSCPHLYN